jgi:membrane-anchored glycerophosphoryl diester phosphodiesterase (GDPDase)
MRNIKAIVTGISTTMIIMMIAGCSEEETPAKRNERYMDYVATSSIYSTVIMTTCHNGNRIYTYNNSIDVVRDSPDCPKSGAE